MVKTAETMGMKGVVSAWEVIEMKLLGVQGAGMLKFETLETGASMDVPYPIGEKGEEIGRLLEDIERGRTVVMELNFPIPTELTIPSIIIGKEVREN